MHIDGHLLIDANDAGNRGSSRFLARERSHFRKRTILACLTDYGDADMINFFASGFTEFTADQADQEMKAALRPYL